MVAFAFAPGRYAFFAILLCLLGGLIGLVIHTRDWYRDLKQFERDRDEFNRKLRER